MPSFVSVGGDKRIDHMCRCLREKGWSDRSDRFRQNRQVDVDLLILPVPAFNRENKVSGTGDLSADALLDLALPPLIVGGMIPLKFARSCENRNVKVCNLTDRNDYAILNAVPTAEAALMIAMEELPVTLWETEVLVTGYGRVAQVLCDRLSALGAKVTVAARDRAALAYATSRGMRGVDIRDRKEVSPGRYRLIFNTVPAPVIDRDFAEQMSPSALTIDLASLPGGCDTDAMESLGRKRIHALSLPGRNAPETAGQILAQVVERIVKEESQCCG